MESARRAKHFYYIMYIRAEKIILKKVKKCLTNCADCV